MTRNYINLSLSRSSFRTWTWMHRYHPKECLVPRRLMMDPMMTSSSSSLASLFNLDDEDTLSLENLILLEIFHSCTIPLPQLATIAIKACLKVSCSPGKISISPPLCSSPFLLLGTNKQKQQLSLLFRGLGYAT